MATPADEKRRQLLSRYSMGKSSPLHWGVVLGLQLERIESHQRTRAQLIRAAANETDTFAAWQIWQDQLQAEWSVYVDAQFEVLALEHLRKYVYRYRRLLTEAEVVAACKAFLADFKAITTLRDAFEHYDTFVRGIGKAAERIDSKQLPAVFFTETTADELEDAEVLLTIGGWSLKLKAAARRGSELAEQLDKAAHRELLGSELIAESFSRRHLA